MVLIEEVLFAFVALIEETLSILQIINIYQQRHTHPIPRSKKVFHTATNIITALHV